jgi:hypothetical protein
MAVQPTQQLTLGKCKLISVGCELVDNLVSDETSMVISN